MTPSDSIEELVHRHDQHHIAWLTLDSQANRNALSRPLTDELAGHLVATARDDTVRAVVLTHAGNVFCAGADLDESATEGGPSHAMARLVDVLRQMVEHPKPLIARVNGAVRGGGIGLVAACDLAVVTAASSFAFSEARLGVAPTVISLTVLPRLTDRAAARWFLTGDRFGGDEAHAMGLVTATVADADGADALIDQWGDSMRQCSPQGLTASKALLTEPILAAFANDGTRLQALSASLFESAEAQEGIAAFKARRPPSWVDA